MLRSGCSRPSVARMGRENHGSAPAARGQEPSFNPPRTGRSKDCSRASSGPSMARRGCCPNAARTGAFIARLRNSDGKDSGSIGGRSCRRGFCKRSHKRKAGFAIVIGPQNAVRLGRRRPVPPQRRSGPYPAGRLASPRVAQITCSSGARIAAMPFHHAASPASAPAGGGCGDSAAAWRWPWLMPSRPGSGRGPRRHQRSSSRARARNGRASWPCARRDA